MSSNKGWIKLHRSLRDNWIWSDPQLVWIWIDILFRANHKPGKVSTKCGVVELEAGQFWTSLDRLSVAWDMHKNTVKKRLLIFQNDGMIKVDSRQGVGTLVTVCNYGVFQGFGDDECNNDSTNVSANASANGGKTKQLENRHKQELKNNKEQQKNEKEKAGPRPGDPDYFEEV